MASPDTELAFSELLDTADRMRRTGGGDRHLLSEMCDAVLLQGLLDRVPHLYRHLCIHAGVITPVDRDRYYVCPVCEAVLDMEES
jgi:hypothetical protein